MFEGLSNGVFHKLFCVLKFPVFFSPPDSSPSCIALYILYISMFVFIHVVSYKLYCFRNKWIESRPIDTCTTGGMYMDMKVIDITLYLRPVYGHPRTHALGCLILFFLTCLSFYRLWKLTQQISSSVTIAYIHHSIIKFFFFISRRVRLNRNTNSFNKVCIEVLSFDFVLESELNIYLKLYNILKKSSERKAFINVLLIPLPVFIWKLCDNAALYLLQYKTHGMDTKREKIIRAFITT